MNLEPNKSQAKVRKKTPTNTFFPPQTISSSTAALLNSKDKFSDHLKKINSHFNKFESICPQTNRSNINSKSKSSSRIPSREQSQIKIKKTDKIEIKPNPFQISKEKKQTGNDCIKNNVFEQCITKNKQGLIDKTNTSLNKNPRQANELHKQNQKYLPKKLTGSTMQLNMKNNRKSEQMNPSTKLLKHPNAMEVYSF